MRPAVVRLLIGMASLVMTLAAAPHHAPARPLRADKIVIEKAARRLTLYLGGSAVRTFQVALGNSPVGPKECEGDNRTPEGTYRIDSRNEHSSFHRSMHITYPNSRDIENARRLHCRPGGEIFIHGLPNGSGSLGAAHRNVDWTWGCIAVTNEEIEEIWTAVPNGTPVEIRP